MQHNKQNPANQVQKDQGQQNPHERNQPQHGQDDQVQRQQNQGQERDPRRDNSNVNQGNRDEDMAARRCPGASRGRILGRTRAASKP